MFYIYKTAAMQTMQFAAKNGYFWANRGIVEADALLSFKNKIYKRYKLNRSRTAFCKDRAKGLAVVKLIIYPCSKHINPNGFYWFLMSTLPLANEQQFDIRQQQLEFADDYRLIRQTKKDTTKPVWTWKLTQFRKESWKKYISDAIKHKDHKQFSKGFKSLAKTPHFFGIRRDRYQLWQFSNHLWKQVYGNSEPLPWLPKNKFKRIVKVEGITQIKRFINEMAKHDRSSEDQLRIFKRNHRKRKSST